MSANRFEGGSGRLYTRVIQTPALRRAVFSLWGSADPLLHLEEIIHAAAHENADGTILDVPCGAGSILPTLVHAGFRGTVIEIDLADAMILRAQATNARLAPPFTVRFTQADARTLPLDDAAVNAAISINGLHVIPEPTRFLTELARVIRPGGSLWLITPVNAPSIRSRAILAAARRLNITPATPPTLPELHRMLETVGFRPRHSLGGTSITGLVCNR